MILSKGEREQGQNHPKTRPATTKPLSAPICTPSSPLLSEGRKRKAPKHGACWWSSPGAAFLKGIRGQKTRATKTRDFYIEAGGWGYTTWPVRLGIENGPSRGRIEITPIKWGDTEEGGKESKGYKPLT